MTRRRAQLALDDTTPWDFGLWAANQDATANDCAAYYGTPVVYVDTDPRTQDEQPSPTLPLFNDCDGEDDGDLFYLFAANC